MCKCVLIQYLERFLQVSDERVNVLESEVESLRCVVEDLRDRELKLQLMVKEKSMMLRENDVPEEFDGHFSKLCDLLEVRVKVR